MILPRYYGHLEKDGLHFDEEGQDERGKGQTSV